jgi:5-formyltetrahydrofolate cyclo-ligase
MPTKVPDSKNVLRHQIQAWLKKMSPTERAEASARVCARLKQQAVWKRAQLILFFAPLPEEIDVWPLLAEALCAGKKIALPRFNSAANAYAACQVENPNHELVTGKFGIREPGPHCAQISPAAADLILVPGVAFDLNGHRLGRGRGFYDRLLTSVRGMKCGVAFDQQVVSEFPVEPHDVRLDCLVTPTRCVEF